MDKTKVMWFATVWIQSFRMLFITATPASNPYLQKISGKVESYMVAARNQQWTDDELWGMLSDITWILMRHYYLGKKGEQMRKLGEIAKETLPPGLWLQDRMEHMMIYL
jgi:hypothetical protein